PDIDCVALGYGVVHIARMLDTGRHHADHFEGLRFEQNLAAGDILCRAQVLAPYAVADHHDSAIAGQLVTALKIAAADRSDAQHAEEIRTHAEARKLDRFAGT